MHKYCTLRVVDFDLIWFDLIWFDLIWWRFDEDLMKIWWRFHGIEFKDINNNNNTISDSESK